MKDEIAKAARQVVATTGGRDQAERESRPKVVTARWCIVAAPGTTGTGLTRRCTVNLDGAAVSLRIVGPAPKVGEVVLVLQTPDNDQWIMGVRDGDSALRDVGAAGQPAFQNGWIANPAHPLAFAKLATGLVALEGIAERNPGTLTVIFTLPAGYVPTRQAYVTVPVYTNGVYGTGNVLIDTAGVVTLHATSTALAGATSVFLTTQFLAA